MATTSLPSSADKPGVTQYRKPRPDLYTLMLAIALVSLLVAILFLYFYNVDFKWEMKSNVPTGMIAATGKIAPWLAGFFG
jgi:hypothetical protein